MNCQLCDAVIEEDAPYIVWHTGGDCHGGCEICAEYQRDGLTSCADCCETVECSGLHLGGRTFAPELEMRIDGWACDLLWHAVWNPTGIGVHDAQVACAWMDRTGGADYDPAMSDLPGGRYASVDEFKRTDGPALLRRLALSDDRLDRLADVYLQPGFGGFVRHTGIFTPEGLLERLGRVGGRPRPA